MDMSGGLRTQTSRAPTQDWVAFLKDQHPRDTAKYVAARIGWSHRTVEKWLARETRPDFDAVAALIDAYGPEFLAAWLPATAVWCAEAARAARRARIQAELAALDDELAALDAAAAL